MTSPLVVKIGGSTLGSGDSSMHDIAALGIAGDIPIVVHGGGAEATRWLEAMSVPSRFEQGLRVTDEAALPVIVAVYAGLVNKRIVASINAAGAPAAGLCGVDAGLVECERGDPVLGFVGNPVTVNLAVINALLAASIVPVVGPVGFVREAGAHQLVNVNADTVAAAIAGAARARELIFLTDVEGVRDGEGRTIERIDPREAEALIAGGVAAGGMVPKLRAAIDAATSGVAARIIDGRRSGALLESAAMGTVIQPG